MSEVGSLLADTVTKLFGDLVTKELVESSEKGVWPEKLWRSLEEGGLTLPLVAESAGGAASSAGCSSAWSNAPAPPSGGRPRSPAMRSRASPSAGTCAR